MEGVGLGLMLYFGNELAKEGVEGCCHVKSKFGMCIVGLGLHT